MKLFHSWNGFFVHRNNFYEQKILREGEHSREYNILIFQGGK